MMDTLTSHGLPEGGRLSFVHSTQWGYVPPPNSAAISALLWNRFNTCSPFCRSSLAHQRTPKVASKTCLIFVASLMEKCFPYVRNIGFTRALLRLFAFSLITLIFRANPLYTWVPHQKESLKCTGSVGNEDILYQHYSKEWNKSYSFDSRKSSVYTKSRTWPWGGMKQ